MQTPTNIVINPSTVIPLRELTFKFSKSGGPGGQNVNKVNTKVTLFFDVSQSVSLHEFQKEKIREMLGNQISSSGVLMIVASEHRTQLANKTAALQRFETKISQALQYRKKRCKTRPTKNSKEKRLQGKRQRSAIKKQRGVVRSDKD